MTDKPRKATWAQRVIVGAAVLETRLEVARARGLLPDAEVIANGVAELINRARDAALRQDGLPTRWWNWWRGTFVEAAHRNLHAARAQMVELYNEAEVAAEAPAALARAYGSLGPDDPRGIRPADLEALPLTRRRARLRRLVEDGYEALDQQHARLRSLRNIVLMSALWISLLAVATVWAVSAYPTVMPLCFPADAAATSGRATLNCPSITGVMAPSGGDVLIVALLGLLGGALAAAVSIRNLDGTATAYDLPVALALLKMPLGALTAIVGLVAIQGDFFPGLSRLDSQGQILAYAFVLGFAQQLFTRLLDRRAETLLAGLPRRRGATTAPPAEPPPGLSATSAPIGAAGATALPVGAAVEAELDEPLEDEPEEPEYLPNPEGDEDDQMQDDEQAELLPDAPEPDDR